MPHAAASAVAIVETASESIVTRPSSGSRVRISSMAWRRPSHRRSTLWVSPRIVITRLFPPYSMTDVQYVGRSRVVRQTDVATISVLLYYDKSNDMGFAQPRLK